MSACFFLGDVHWMARVADLPHASFGGPDSEVAKASRARNALPALMHTLSQSIVFRGTGG
jgi:hypothetical protein